MSTDDHARARAIAEQLWAEVGDITHGNYDAETFRIRAGESWIAILESALTAAVATAKTEYDELHRTTQGLLEAATIRTQQLEAELEHSLSVTADWRSWAIFVYLGNQGDEKTDAELRAAVCATHDADTAALKLRAEAAEATADAPTSAKEGRQHLQYCPSHPLNSTCICDPEAKASQ